MGSDIFLPLSSPFSHWVRKLAVPSSYRTGASLTQAALTWTLPQGHKSRWDAQKEKNGFTTGDVGDGYTTM